MTIRSPAQPVEVDTSEVPSQRTQLQELKIYSHSTLLYWWPAWAFGYLAAVITAAQERFLTTPAGARPSSSVGLTFVAISLLLIVFSNIRLRGMNSVVAILSVAFLTLLLAWLGWWDDIASIIPYLWVNMNSGFYLVFSTGLLVIWLLMFFVFDRLTLWRIRPGQMTIEHLVGGGAESFDTSGLRFERLGSDFFRHIVGFGAGDLKVTSTTSDEATIDIHNVIFVQRKVDTIEKLISVKPDSTA